MLNKIRRMLSAPGIGRRVASRGADEPQAGAQDGERRRLRLMRRDLFRLMEQHADSRRLMRHLGLVERSLRRQGLAAVESLPTGVIAKALVQLESLVHDWSSDGLADVRSRMAVMLRDRPEAIDTSHQIGASLAELGHGLLTSDDVDVSEADHAAFEEMERSWVGRMPAQQA